MDTVQNDFPFSQSIELTKPVPKGGHHFYWKAEIENAGLTIRTWFGDNTGAPFDGFAVRTHRRLFDPSFGSIADIA